MSRAVERMAKRVGAEMEFFTIEGIPSTFVYYKKNGGDRMPVYNDMGKEGRKEEEVFHSILSVVFALSFLPSFSGFENVRGG